MKNDIVKGEVDKTVAMATCLMVSTPEEFNKSTEILSGIKGLKGKIEQFMEPINTQLKALKKTVSDQSKTLLDPLEEAEDILKKKRVAFSEKDKSVPIDVREYWSAEVTDLMALCQAVVAGKVPIGAISPNSTFLNGMAKNLQKAMSIPGVKAVSRKGETFGAKGVE